MTAEFIDVTTLIQDSDPIDSSACEAESAYVAFFESLTKALYFGNVALIYEPGVMPLSMLAEYGRWTMRRRFPFLIGAQFVSAELGRVPDRHFSRYLLNYLNDFASPQKIVLCLNGISKAFSCQAAYDECLAEYISKAEHRLIALISQTEWRQVADGDWVNHGQWKVLDAPAPTEHLAAQLVATAASGLERKYHIHIEDGAIKSSIGLTDQYVLTSRQPGKALDVLEAACKNVEFEISQLGAGPRAVTSQDVQTVIEETLGVPPSSFSLDAERVNYHQYLATEIFGQDDALTEIARELDLIRAGLTDKNKPASVMMFIGQTGTGKTELAKSLARLYAGSRRLRVYTLGNFSESHSVSGLIGVPAGYVGHDQGGRLINDLNADSSAVILLDEADKAHPDVLQPLLNLFDEGWITDQRGVRAYANRAIFILTTNVGQRMIGDLAKQGKSAGEISTRMKEALSQLRHAKSNRPVFTPEFLARTKKLVVFMPLSLQAMASICRNRIERVCDTWMARTSKKIIVTEDLVLQMSKQAYDADQKSDGREGGRIVWKIISDSVESRLLTAITSRFEEFQSSQSICVCPERVVFE